MYNSQSELISAIKDGTYNAFQELVISFDGFIKKTVNSSDVSDTEKDDLYQEGLIGLYKAVISYNENSDASFSTYANVCIRHSIISALRKYYGKENMRFRYSLTLDSESIEPLVITQASPDESIIEREEYEALMQKIDSSLSVYERKVLKLYLKGMTYEEISKALNTSVKSIDNAIQRIRSKLKNVNTSV